MKIWLQSATEAVSLAGIDCPEFARGVKMVPTSLAGRNSLIHIPSVFCRPVFEVEVQSGICVFRQLAQRGEFFKPQ